MANVIFMILAIGILTFIAIMGIVILFKTLTGDGLSFKNFFKSLHVETPERKAGRLGERFANQIISEILREDDVLLCNVAIQTQGQQTELDSVIVNDRGIFFFEVKNWVGEVFGSEEDTEWIKNKETYPGNVYQKTVKNPICQVKREIYLLSRFLKERGLSVWVEGYVFFVNHNSPVQSEYVVWTREDMDRVIHYGRDEKLSGALKEKILAELTKMPVR